MSEPEADRDADKGADEKDRRTRGDPRVPADGTADLEMDVRRFGVDDFAGEPAFEIFGQGQGAGITPLRVKLQATQTNRLESVLHWMGRFGSGQARWMNVPSFEFRVHCAQCFEEESRREH